MCKSVLTAEAPLALTAQPSLSPYTTSVKDV